MSLLSRIKKQFRKQKITAPGEAYDLWAAAYDHQPGNLMLDLDARLTTDMLDLVTITDKVVVDVGCGTGRHWEKMLSCHPSRLLGFDVSAGMLEVLQEKFPGATTCLLTSNRLEGLSAHSVDVLISTLAIAHIENIREALTEWDKVLKPGASIFISDYHPQALARGGERTFKHKGQLVSVKNYVHPIAELKRIMGQLGWQEVRFTEKKIDESVRDYYIARQALPLYEQFKGVSIIFGILLKKKNDSL